MDYRVSDSPAPKQGVSSGEGAAPHRPGPGPQRDESCTEGGAQPRRAPIATLHCTPDLVPSWSLPRSSRAARDQRRGPTVGRARHRCRQPQAMRSARLACEHQRFRHLFKPERQEPVLSEIQLASQRTLERREVASLPSRRNARSPSGRLDSAGAAGPVPSPTTLIFAARCSLPALAGGAPSKSAESRLTRKQHAAAKAGDPGIRREPRSWSALAYKRSRRGPPEPLARASWSAPIVVT